MGCEGHPRCRRLPSTTRRRVRVGAVSDWAYRAGVGRVVRVTSFIAWAMSVLAPPVSVVNQAPIEIPQGWAWCTNKLCDQPRVYDVLPGHPASKLYGEVPDYAFCTFCGTWLPDVYPEDKEAS
jgi:hypothetical protein